MSRPRTLLQRVRRIWGTAGLCVLLASPVVIWATFRAQGFPASVLTSDARLEVREDDERLEFRPRAASADVARRAGLILFPGCPVDPYAYAPTLRAVAEAGYTAVVIRVPWRCGFSDGHQLEALDRARRAMSARPGLRWIAAGHSKGGHTASLLALRTRELAGLVLVATSHPRHVSLSHLTLPTVRLTATQDGLATARALERSAANLPRGTRTIPIDGGNHAQFGWYGFQLFDGRARITRDDQQAVFVRLLLEELRSAENGAK